MSAKDYRGPAFPSHGTMGEVNHQGMTLRQGYAGLAMQGILADATSGDQSIAYCAQVIGIDPLEWKPEIHWPQFCANRAFAMADAMLEHEAREAAK